MHEFFRGPQWASDSARVEFEEKIRIASNLWNELESMSVPGGIRSSALFSVTPEELALMSRTATLQKLGVSVLQAQPLGENYSAATPLHGSPGLRVAMHAPGLASDWHRAWGGSDDPAIGALLGFPDCCIEFFSRVWKEGRKRDTTLSMETIEGPPQSNILLRWLGVRFVPHLPCSAACKDTLKLADLFIELANANGLAPEVEVAMSLLSLPMSYSVLNGVGVVETEYFRFCFSTDYTLGEEKLQRAGSKFEMPKVDPALAHWQDNGFNDIRAMRQAHSAMIAIVGTTETVLDLGCGDGALIASMRMAGMVKEAWGYEADAGRAARAKTRYPDVKVINQRIEDATDFKAHTVLLMPGRLLEMGEEKAAVVKGALCEQAGRVIVYSYDGNLLSLAEQTGLVLGKGMFEGNGAQVAEVTAWQ